MLGEDFDFSLLPTNMKSVSEEFNLPHPSVSEQNLPKKWEEFEKSIMMLFWQANFLEPKLVLYSFMKQDFVAV